jgi:hypothetical protein
MSDAVKWQSALRRKEILYCCSSCASFDLFENMKTEGINLNSGSNLYSIVKKIISK